MVRIITRQQYEADAAAVLDAVRETKEPVVVESDGAAAVALISAEDYEQWAETRQQRAWDVVDRIRERNADQDPEEILAFVTEIVEEVRQEQYERDLKASQSSH
jgi:prevent-host-death family protein